MMHEQMISFIVSAITTAVVVIYWLPVVEKKPIIEMLVTCYPLKDVPIETLNYNRKDVSNKVPVSHTTLTYKKQPSVSGQ